MFNTSSIILNPGSPHLNLLAVSPFVLSIDPHLTNTLDKVYKIIYDFDDGTVPVEIFLQPRPNESDLSSNFPYEIKDPRNEIVSHTFILHKQINRTYNISVKIFPVLVSYTNPNYTEYTIALNLKAPYLNSSSIATSGNFFEDIHLVNTRMFDYDNTILYNFESVNPYYLLPTIVRWHETCDDLNPPPFLFDPEYSPRGRYPR